MDGSNEEPQASSRVEEQKEKESRDTRNRDVSQFSLKRGFFDDQSPTISINFDRNNDVSLREWLDVTKRVVDPPECLHIFWQVVELVSSAHEDGIAIGNIRPSFFVMSSYNRVSFIESASCSSSSGSYEEGTSPGNGAEVVRGDEFGSNFEEMKKKFPLKQILVLELGWYTSPDEVAGGTSSLVSDIYKLGVLLFELFCEFNSSEEKLRAMSNLRHRVLPPQLLLKWPKVASFCLWLLHPLSKNRPKISEILNSELLNEARSRYEESEAAIKLRQEREDQELLLEFLVQLQQRKQDMARKLQSTVRFLSSDIKEVSRQKSIIDRRNPLLKTEKDKQTETENNESIGSISRKRFRQRFLSSNEKMCEKAEEDVSSEEQASNKQNILSTNFKKLESAYFLARRRKNKATQETQRRGSISKNAVDDVVSREAEVDRNGNWINPFLEGLCKHMAYSKLKVRASLQHGEFSTMNNLVCSLGFDRDKELFATAGVNRKIKIFECDSILNEDHDIHYPVLEMSCSSKLSSICWNGYIKSQIASSDFEGVIQIWDTTKSQAVMEMKEHERRVWSIDFSLADPTKLASGSDDGSVKLWNINQGRSVGTIKTKANICSVQFSPNSSHSLAIGSADHRVYCYDLRSLREPWCTLVGHTKTVSFVKFLDSSTLVSASTDNTLKLWDLSTRTSGVLDDPSQTFTGHTNTKNFVGLSVSDGYIATGSETNEVFVYHKAFPMPMLSHKFNSIDPSGNQEEDETGQFVSCVCGRGQSSLLVAANSRGNIKLLEMV